MSDDIVEKARVQGLDLGYLGIVDMKASVGGKLDRRTVHRTAEVPPNHGARIATKAVFFEPLGVQRVAPAGVFKAIDQHGVEAAVHNFFYPPIDRQIC